MGCAGGWNSRLHPRRPVLCSWLGLSQFTLFLHASMSPCIPWLAYVDCKLFEQGLPFAIGMSLLQQQSRSGVFNLFGSVHPWWLDVENCTHGSQMQNGCRCGMWWMDAQVDAKWSGGEVAHSNCCCSAFGCVTFPCPPCPAGRIVYGSTPSPPTHMYPQGPP